jgi:hypothetical protein
VIDLKGMFECYSGGNCIYLVDAAGPYALFRSSVQGDRAGETSQAALFQAGNSKPLRTYKDVVFAVWLPEDAPTPLGIDVGSLE